VEKSRADIGFEPKFLTHTQRVVVRTYLRQARQFGRDTSATLTRIEETL